MLNQTKVYKYDKAGNIILKKTYDYSLEENLKGEAKIDEYIYDCEKRDQLIRFNNQEISYDTMGRPIVYKGKEYKWNTLNQLEEIPSLNVKYEYDVNGIRNKKIINGIETTYILEGSKIHQIKTDAYKITLKYALNKVIGFVYNKGGSNKTYIYQRNILGDIIGIFDEEGNQVAKYEYDSYGNCTIPSDYQESEIAKINPFRYRGYYYDEETGLYYLNSRYYDPETGRFISPDTLTILDETRSQINGLNLYMYCGDNPIMRVDPSGMAWWEFWKWDWGKIALIGAVAIGAIAVGILTGGAAFAALGTYGLAVAIGGALVAGTAAAIGWAASWGLFANAFTYIETEIYVALNYDKIELEQKDFNEFGDLSAETPTFGWSRDKKLKYIKYLRQQGKNKKWTVGQMLREFEYHDGAYYFFTSFGQDPNNINTFAYKAKHVDFEEEQTLKTYIRRIIGNFFF